MTQNTKTTYTIENESDFPFLNSVKQFKQLKTNAQKQKKWNNFLVKSGPLMTKWFNFMNPDYVLVEFNQKQKKVKFYSSHDFYTLSDNLTQKRMSAAILFNQIRSPNQKIYMGITKKFINGKISPNFNYNWVKYSDQQSQKPSFQRKIKAGFKFNLNKWLSNSIKTNQKKIYLSYQQKLKQKFIWFNNVQAGLHIANRQNSFFQNPKNKQVLQNKVKQSSDILGYDLQVSNQILQLKLKGGYDYFHRYNFNKLMFKCANFKQFSNYTVDMMLRGGIVLGSNIMQNDLLNRNKNRWVEDRSLMFLNPRISLYLNNFMSIFSETLQPFFYLSAWASKNTCQVKTKYQLDYGIGVKFSKYEFQLQYSLFRMGKNLDDISTGIKLNF